MMGKLDGKVAFVVSVGYDLLLKQSGKTNK